jgi:predicted secreted hydrolase
MARMSTALAHSPQRRILLCGGLGAMALNPTHVWATPLGVHPRVLRFPDDHGAHPDTRIEWWYATGALWADARLHGFQVTFFRSRTPVPAQHPSRFAARQLVFAHVALTDLSARRLRHDQRVARSGFGIAAAAEGDTDVKVQGWSLRREGSPAHSVYRAQTHSEAARFGLDLTLTATQAVLLQGDAGYSRKGPRPEQASHYYSQPQLAVQGMLTLDGARLPVQGRAWLDHEWSEELLDPQAVGWDWIGMNLDDGSALTAFRVRGAGGHALWAGGSLRAPGGAARIFTPDEVTFDPGRTWSSPSSRARYPVEWKVYTPLGRYAVKALLDAQELDSRASTGSIYWEGLSELQDESGRRLGLGYLEMTGYAGALRL